MLFHADRNVKENMFQTLKREAEINIARKNEERILKRNEERMRIESIMQKEREETEKVKMQKTTAHFCTTIIFVTLRLANQKQKQTDVDENSRWPFLLGARKTFSPVRAV